MRATPLYPVACVAYLMQGKRLPPQEKLDRLSELIEPWFIFSLVWSVGATGDADSWQMFSAWLRDKMAEERVRAVPFSFFLMNNFIFVLFLSDGVCTLQPCNKSACS